MLSAEIVRSCPVVKTARTLQVSGMFDLAPTAKSEERWVVNLDLPEAWNVGLIVGPSGSGKTTIAKEFFGAELVSDWDWPRDKSIVDGFPASMDAKDITALLSSVGFSSPPLWLRPFHVLSNGQQFRVHLARTLAERPGLSVVDEFTSVVDRTVAQIGSAAVAKAVRRRGQQFVGVSCHFDIIDWMEPDWVYYVHTGELARGRLHRRPEIELEIRRCHHSCWEIFRPYHYLDHSFHKAARCFVAFYQGRPVALQAVIYQQHPKAKNLYRGHRAVCLPDFQGVGIGNALIDTVASAYRGIGNRIISTTASPSLNISRKKSPRWKCITGPHIARQYSATSTMAGKPTAAINRLTTTWEYIGAPMEAAQARALIFG